MPQRTSFFVTLTILGLVGTSVSLNCYSCPLYYCNIMKCPELPSSVPPMNFSCSWRLNPKYPKQILDSGCIQKDVATMFGIVNSGCVETNLTDFKNKAKRAKDNYMAPLSPAQKKTVEDYDKKYREAHNSRSTGDNSPLRFCACPTNGCNAFDVMVTTSACSATSIFRLFLAISSAIMSLVQVLS